MASRRKEMRAELYNALAKGDVDKAQDAMNLMMLAGIDSDIIIAANKASRPAIVDGEVKPFPLPQGEVGTWLGDLEAS